ncbi:MAG TPA: UPF0280 family protein [Syntrophorhabdales bacterium]|nr:UPF0280 family protein [Syntrophorhabdales bacterium]
MLLDIGPATIVINGEKEGKPYIFDRKPLAEQVERILAEIRDYLPVLKQKAFRIRRSDSLPPVARSMVSAVKAVDEASLTPMAAVAGAVAEQLKDAISDKGLQFISVNNGGDIAIVNRRGRPVGIAIGDMEQGRTTPYVVKVSELIDFGVATSGFGGRSFTLGLADIVTVVASSAPLADAAATFIGNSTNVEANTVERRRAAEIDPATDIADEMVTVHVGNLTGEQVAGALGRGRAVAERLKRQGTISDAVIILKGQMVSTISGNGNIRLEVTHGN